MKILYIECNMGVAGDMLMSALSELHPDPKGFVERLNALNLPGVMVEHVSEVKKGISGTHIKVMIHGKEEDEHLHEHEEEHHHEHSHEHSHEHNHEHSHEHSHHHTHVHVGMREIENTITSLPVSDRVRNDALAVYKLIAEAESAAHNCDVSEIHFHEVGTMDAIADIVGVCMLMEEINPDLIVSSPINTGKGTVKCAHGILPVPAPATAYILKGIPVYSNEINGELCTPTGAALVKYFSGKYGSMPQMSVSAIGYGFGTREYETLNCVRTFIGETEDTTDRIVQLSCNMDDVSGERIAFAQKKLFQAGALDVFTIPVVMKKSRPGVLFNCICRQEDRETMIRLIFRHTSTIGIRETVCERYILDRAEETVSTPYGNIRLKRSKGYGVEKVKPEYDDLEKLAMENDIDITDIDFQ